jgi:condensin complex subunit 1
MAVSAFEDKVAGVRRNGISLIVKLMVTHPYGLMHGGLLGMEEWVDWYREVVKELQTTEKVLDDTLSGNTGEADGDEAAKSSAHKEAIAVNVVHSQTVSLLLIVIEQASKQRC